MMNYQSHYQALINKYGKTLRPLDSKDFERHHITPKSYGGDNSILNLVYLTGRQHLLAHWLLFKIHDTSEMAMAFFMMRSNKSNYKLTKLEDELAFKAMRDKGLMSKAVRTPVGDFESYRDAAAAIGLPESTFQDIIRNNTEGFKDLRSERKLVAAKEAQHGMSRRIFTPLGVFPYVSAASKAHGISNKTISRRCESDPDNYFYLDPPKQCRTGLKSPNAKEVITPLGIFGSTMEAAIALGISRDVMRSRIRSAYLTEYHFV
jgi:hypothetical protein